MSINKILAFTIVAILVALEHGRPCAGEHGTDEQPFDEWFHIAVTSPHTYTEGTSFTCVTVNLTRSHHDKNSIILEFHREINGELFIERGYGKVVGSELYTTFPTRTTPKSIYTITTYDDGRALILSSKTDKSSNILLSRKPKTPAEVVAVFEKLARKLGLNVVYTSHGDCVYDENGIDYLPGTLTKTFKKH